MKRLLALLIVLAMCFALTACGPKEKDYIGEYECEAMEAGGMTLNPSDLGMDIYVELEEGGKGVFYFEEEQDIEWSIKDETTLILEADGDELEVEYEEGVLILDLDGEGTLWLVGKGADLPEDIAEKLEGKGGGLGSLLAGLIDGVEEPAEEPAEAPDEEPAVEEPAVEEPTEEPEEVAAPVEFEPVTAMLADYEVTVLGAEAFIDSDDKPAIRVYYDFYNYSDETVAAWDVLDFAVEQDGYEIDTTYAWSEDDVPEYGNDSLGVRPGCGIRCIAEYSMKPDGGPMTFKFYDFWEEMGELEVFFDPANLPGAPTDEFVIEPILEPEWAIQYSDEGTLDDGSWVYIDAADVYTGDAGEMMLRVYLEYTNGTEEPCSPWLSMTIDAYQDGVELVADYYIGEESDDLFMEDIEPGETVYCSVCFLMRNDNPVEVEITNWNEPNIGCYFE